MYLTFDKVISIAALLIAVYSVYYTHKTNNFRVHVDNTVISLGGFNPYLLSFEILNDSPKAIYLEGLTISGKGLKLLPEHQYVKPNNTYILPDVEQSPFVSKTLLSVNTPVEFSYYIAEPVDLVTITIKTNVHIRCFSKATSISVRPYYCE